MYSRKAFKVFRHPPNLRIYVFKQYFDKPFFMSVVVGWAPLLVHNLSISSKRLISVISLYTVGFNSA